MKALTTWILRDGWQVAKYGITGAVGGLIQVLFLYVFVDIFNFWYIYGVVFAYPIALIIVFSMQKFWTFQDYSMDVIHRQSLMYTIITFCALLLNILMMYILVDIVHVWHIAAQVIVVGVIGVSSFFMNKAFTFNNKTDTEQNLSSIKFCHICNSEKINIYCKKNGYTLYRCRVCDFIFVHPIPDDLKTVYGEDYFHNTGKQEFGYSDYDEDKDSMKHVFERYLKLFEKTSKNKTIMDIGCATGYFLDRAKERGWKTYGVEISKFAADEAESRGHTVYVGELPKLNIEEKVDVVTMWDVLEHVDNPRAYLEAAYEMLNKDGYISINTVDTSSLWARIMGKRWHLIVPPEHIHYYTPKNLSLLLKQTNFDVKDIRKIGKRFSLPYFFTIGYRWQGLRIWKYCAEAFDKPFWRKLSLPVNLRDNIFVLARKI